MNSLFCRIYQGAMKVGMYMLPWHTPEVIEDRADSDRLLEDIKRREVERLLVVMGPNMMKRRSRKASGSIMRKTHRG